MKQGEVLALNSTVIEFVKSDTPLAVEVNKAYAVIKETEKPKYLPGQIVKRMQAEGFPKFNMHHLCPAKSRSALVLFLKMASF